ncbi:hypothetical protein [Proteus mirabilis]|uniref:hypothetical protein n=3 Tax=Proteus mirabilis TaxID=584 RepID=UPI002358DC0B|nr:hypothetical protein [Proteus mirabilis]MDH7534627.1 hypothetical protein [Proteus mirabilis]MDM3709821.1 hypothetical protein [Proteus mirabilis]MDM3781772.1 hypothetical protein [Proteus mirabilis]WCT07069.1 hypothetical protein PRR80_13685 [Proteus mirabilis]
MMPIENDGIFVSNDTPIKMGVSPNLTFADRNGTVIIVTDRSPQQNINYEQPQQTESRINVGRKEFWLGITGVIITVALAIVGSVWSIANHVNNSTNESRREVQTSINANKQEVVALLNASDSRNNDRFNRVDSQFDKVDIKFDKLESKIDDNFKDTNKNINEIKDLIVKSK